MQVHSTTSPFLCGDDADDNDAFGLNNKASRDYISWTHSLLKARSCTALADYMARALAMTNGQEARFNDLECGACAVQYMMLKRTAAGQIRPTVPKGACESYKKINKVC